MYIAVKEEKSWQQARDEIDRRTAWLDDEENPGRFLYAPDFLSLFLEVFCLLFPKTRAKLYDAYATWCKLKEIQPTESTVKYGIHKRDQLRMVHRYLKKPTEEGLEEFIEALEEGASFKN